MRSASMPSSCSPIDMWAARRRGPGRFSAAVTPADNAARRSVIAATNFLVSASWARLGIVGGDEFQGVFRAGNARRQSAAFAGELSQPGDRDTEALGALLVDHPRAAIAARRPPVPVPVPAVATPSSCAESGWGEHLPSRAVRNWVSATRTAVRSEFRFALSSAPIALFSDRSAALMRLASFLAASFASILASTLARALRARASARLVARLLRLLNRPIDIAFRGLGRGAVRYRTSGLNTIACY